MNKKALHEGFKNNGLNGCTKQRIKTKQMTRIDQKLIRHADIRRKG